MSAPLRVSEVRSRGSLLEIQAPWKDLADRLEDASPFLTPQFLLPYLQPFENTHEYRVVTVWDGDRLVGLAPLLRRRIGKFGLRFSMLSFPIRDTAPPPFNVLIDPCADGVVEALVNVWTSQDDWDLLELQNVRSNSGTKERLRPALADVNLGMAIERSRIGLYVPITGTWEQYCQSLSRNTRQRQRQAQNRCLEMGSVGIVRYPSDETSLDTALSMMSVVVDRSWKRSERPLQSTPGDVFHLARQLGKSGMLDLRFLTIDDRPVAYLFHLDHRRRLSAFHIAYDLDYQRHGPAILLLADGIRHAHERGDERYDLLGEKSIHLSRWTRHYETYESIRVVNRRVASRLIAGLYLTIHRRRVARARRMTDKRKETAKATARRDPARVGSTRPVSTV